MVKHVINLAMGMDEEFILLGKKISLVSEYGNKMAELLVKLLLGIVSRGKVKAVKRAMDKAELGSEVGVEEDGLKAEEKEVDHGNMVDQIQRKLVEKRVEVE